MPDFTPTPEQLAIVEFAQNETANLAIVARAGAAKTSTLVLVAEALPSLDILCLAFNKAIAKEMTERLPANCTAKTLHGLGYGAWAKFIPSRIQLQNSKCFQLLKNALDGLDKEDRDAMQELFSETLDVVGKAKSAGYLPGKCKGHWKPIITDGAEFYSSLPMELSRLQEQVIDTILVASFKSALQGEIDFDDMIYCPAICNVSWPRHDLYLVDESQDLSPLNHHVLKKMVKTRRIIAVGDPFQAIYGFRGADTKSMENLIAAFSMDELHLTISFRCGKKIIKQAQWRAPDMQAPEWAKEGSVEVVSSWSITDFDLNDAVICRNNAPLFRLAIQMIEQGKSPQLAGRDLAVPLKKIMKKLGKPTTTRDNAMAALDRWKNQELKRARPSGEGRILDQAACLATIIQVTESLGDAIAYLDHLLARPGRVHLMTGHKSKGLEFENVWFYNSSLCNMKEEQDRNLRYVIETRAKSNLRYINDDGRVED